MKIILGLFLCLTFTGYGFGQAKKPVAKPTPKPPIIEIEAVTKDGKAVILSSDGTWRYSDKAPVEVAPPKTENRNLDVEAAVIYRSGEVVPVSRTTFYLLDAELLSILKAAGIQPKAETLQILKDADMALLSDVSYSLTPKYQSIYGDYGARVLDAIKPHVLSQVTTDFQGKATFVGLEPKSYNLFGVGSTRQSNILWNMKIDASKEGKLLLDQNNAARAY